MGKQVNVGRWTSPRETNEDVVVFLVGMRINRLRAVRKWIRPFLAMPRMLRELAAQPELGLLSARTFFSGRDAMVVQYWRSVDHLNAYARTNDHLHLPAWRAFNEAVGTSDRVGIWHETYRITPGTFEAIYANMPAMGLAGAFGGPVPVGQGRQSAAARMDERRADEPVLAPY